MNDPIEAALKVLNERGEFETAAQLRETANDLIKDRTDAIDLLKRMYDEAVRIAPHSVILLAETRATLTRFNR